MRQKYAVYLKGKALFLNNTAPSGTIQIPGTDLQALLEAIKTLNTSENVSLPEIDPEAGLELLKQHFPCITAAGGIVESENGNILLIFRLETWDLPKGKVEPDESNTEAAAREIEEETGIAPGLPSSLICRTWHSYMTKKGEIFKETFWFHFKVRVETKPVVQLEEQITHAGWYSLKEALSLNPNMYPSVKDVLENFSQIKSGPVF